MSAGKDRGRRSSAGAIDPIGSVGSREDARAQRRVKQVCREVERTLSYALGACDDEALQQLTLIAVEPAPDASRLRVIVGGGTPATEKELRQRLRTMAGALRAEIAAALQHKRTPELTFEVIPGVGEPA